MGISVLDMRFYGVSDNAYLGYKSVQSLMTWVDPPDSSNQVVHGGAQLPDLLFDHR